MSDLQTIPQNTTVALRASVNTVQNQSLLSIPANLPGAAFESICSEIVREQAGIISRRLVIEQLQQIPGLIVDPQTLRCSISGDGAAIINQVVNSFSQFFGSAAVEVCREAADRYLQKLPHP